MPFAIAVIAIGVVGYAGILALETLPTSGDRPVATTGQTSTPLPPDAGAVTGQPAATARTDGNIETGLIVLLIVLSGATLISVAITFYLYRWRRLLLANPHMVVPEEFGRWTRDVVKAISALDRSIMVNTKGVERWGGSTEKSVADLVDTFMTLQKALDERDAEIRRLKAGYDVHIFQKFIGRFIRVDQAIEDFIGMGKFDKDGFEQIRAVLEDALDECDVERFAPDIGVDYRQANGVADNPKIVVPESQEDEFKIIEVLEPGYRIRGQEGFEVILASKVRINGAWNEENQQ